MRAQTCIEGSNPSLSAKVSAKKPREIGAFLFSAHRTLRWLLKGSKNTVASHVLADARDAHMQDLVAGFLDELSASAL